MPSRMDEGSFQLELGVLGVVTPQGTVDAPASFVYEGYTYVPARAISEVVGYPIVYLETGRQGEAAVELLTDQGVLEFMLTSGQVSLWRTDDLFIELSGPDCLLINDRLFMSEHLLGRFFGYTSLCYKNTTRYVRAELERKSLR